MSYLVSRKGRKLNRKVISNPEYNLDNKGSC
jgi:hypothetical protein